MYFSHFQKGYYDLKGDGNYKLLTDLNNDEYYFLLTQHLKISLVTPWLL